MKRCIILLFFLSLVSVPSFSNECIDNADKSASASRQNASLLQPSALFDGAEAYSSVTVKMLEEAIRAGIPEVRQQVAKLRKDVSEPTFENTIEVLEKIEDPITRAQNLLGNYLHMNSSKELEDLYTALVPELTELSNSYQRDSVIFGRVEKLYKARNRLKLNREQKRLLELAYQNFVRNGVKLSQAKKDELLAIESELAKAKQKFSDNLREATNAFQLEVTNASDLGAMPPHAVSAAKEAARKAGKEASWIFTLKAPSLGPFMENCTNSALREKLWKAYFSRAMSGPYDNRELLLQIVALRQRQAKILGYSSFSHYALQDSMAKNPETAIAFLKRLGAVYRQAAEREMASMREFAGTEIRPWDTAFWSKKQHDHLFQFDEEELRPYFQLDKVVQGVFYTATRLYGLSFRSRPDLPVWDPSVKVYEVHDSKGEYLALFYLDPFPRDMKRPGAWMNDLRSVQNYQGISVRPHVVNVGNFSPPVAGTPALLSVGEVTTVFHEFGHALHSMLTRVSYPSIAGTNVSVDFVELPSQIFENWAFEPEVLSVYAHHYRTGAPIPMALLNKFQQDRNFQAGLSGLGQIRYGMLDFAWYTGNLDGIHNVDDIVAWENGVLAPYRLTPAVPGTLLSTTFNHIFGGGYSSRYYGYKWSDVLAKDAFDVFKREGIFNPRTAGRFRKFILEMGNSEDPAVLYRQFRGGDPDPDALLRSEGLLP